MTDLRALVARLGGRYSAALGLELGGGDPAALCRWLLASCLYGAPLSESIARNTYCAFRHAGVLLPGEILATGWDGLVAILDRGGYVRYDFKTASKLLEVSRNLLDRYGGDPNHLHAAAADAADLEARLMALGKGIGPVTAGIFLRELRGIWDKADPLPSDRAVAAARDLGLVPPEMEDRREILERLRQRWEEAGGGPEDFPDFEAALVRHGMGLRGRRERRRSGA
jgi:endonuclease III